ncbi:MAG: class I SAM-dependent methyltransferase [Bdellovibrionales bacterium]
MNKRHCISAPPIIEEHRALLTDTVCQQSYKAMIENSVRPGDVVLDIGTGTGIHAMFAAQAGASKVYAVDVDPMIALAKEAARANGFDQIEFIQMDSLQLELPEKVDVIIANLGFLGSIETLPDARKRFLKPDGRMIPDALQMTFVPLVKNEFYNSTVGFWGQPQFGLDFSQFKQVAAFHPQYDFFNDEEFLSEPADGAMIEFNDQFSQDHAWNLNFSVDQSGECCGFPRVGTVFLRRQYLYFIKPPIQMHKMFLESNFPPV